MRSNPAEVLSTPICKSISHKNFWNFVFMIRTYMLYCAWIWLQMCWNEWYISNGTGRFIRIHICFLVGGDVLRLLWNWQFSHDLEAFYFIREIFQILGIREEKKKLEKKKKITKLCEFFFARQDVCSFHFKWQRHNIREMLFPASHWCLRLLFFFFFGSTFMDSTVECNVICIS